MASLEMDRLAALTFKERDVDPSDQSPEHDEGEKLQLNELLDLVDRGLSWEWNGRFVITYTSTGQVKIEMVPTG